MTTTLPNFNLSLSLLSITVTLGWMPHYGWAQAVDTTNKDEILLEDFSSPSSLYHDWTTLNDPVMGGKSHSHLRLNNGVAHFSGRCAVVPFLRAPGFITMVTGGFFQEREIFADVSSCGALKVVARSRQAYAGYYVSFGTARVPGGGHASGYKAPLPQLAQATDDFQEIVLPFGTFSKKWDEATGEIQVTCQQDAQYCPDVATLQNMKTMSFWAEGVEGDVDLEIQSISAVQCASTTTSNDGSALPSSSSQALLRESSSSSSSAGSWMTGGAFLLAAGMVAAITVVMKKRQGRRQEESQQIYGGAGIFKTDYASVPEIQLE